MNRVMPLRLRRSASSIVYYSSSYVHNPFVSIKVHFWIGSSRDNELKRNLQDVVINTKGPFWIGIFNWIENKGVAQTNYFIMLKITSAAVLSSYGHPTPPLLHELRNATTNNSAPTPRMFFIDFDCIILYLFDCGLNNI